MARGQYLRTNYRSTGGLADITAIGGGFGTAAAQGGVGNPRPYGGFIYITSYCVSIGGSTKTWSNWIADSAYGILSWFFTSLSPGSGYKFLPLGWNFRSVSDYKVGSLGQSHSPMVYHQPVFASMTFTSSVFALLFAKPCAPANTGSTGTVVS